MWGRKEERARERERGGCQMKHEYSYHFAYQGSMHLTWAEVEEILTWVKYKISIILMCENGICMTESSNGFKKPHGLTGTLLRFRECVWREIGGEKHYFLVECHKVHTIQGNQCSQSKHKQVHDAQRPESGVKYWLRSSAETFLVVSSFFLKDVPQSQNLSFCLPKIWP